MFKAHINMEDVTLKEKDIVLDAPVAAKAEAVPAESAAPSSYATKMAIVARALQNIEQSVAALRKMLEEDRDLAEISRSASAGVGFFPREGSARGEVVSGSRVVEGVFDGSLMVGADGKPYSVPPNYASKSKLVEGDMMKLTITPTGTFIYKQLGPIARDRVVGVLGFDEQLNEYYVSRGTDKWKVLKASVTYYKGQPGDEAIVLVPKDVPATWAAIDNIVSREIGL